MIRDLRRHLHAYDREEMKLHKELVDRMISIPQHAELFRVALETERAKLRPGDFRGSYESLCYNYLGGTLAELPSPQTVAILGQFLEDDRDIPGKPPKARGDSVQYPGNAMVALEAISKLWIRALPEFEMWQKQLPTRWITMDARAKITS